MKSFPLWHNRQFVVLSVAQLFSSLGIWLLYLAVMLLIAIHWHHGPLAVAMGIVAMMVPQIVVRPYAGMLADRFNRKRLMGISNVLSALAASLLLLVQNLWQLYAVLACLGMFDAFFSPAESGVIKEIVADDDMDRAMSIRMMIAQGTKIIGPGLSGVLVAFFNARIPFLVDGIDFVASASLIFFVRGGRAHLKDSANESAPPLRYADGFHFLWHDLALRRLMVFFTIILTIIQLVDSQFVILLRGAENAGQLVGFTMSASGIGMAAAAAWVAHRHILRPLRWMSAGSVAVGVGLGSVALLVQNGWAWAVPFIVLVAVAGGASLAIIPFQTALQHATPVEWSGRVMAAVGAVTTAGAVAGPLLGGAAVKMIGIMPAYIAAGSLLVIVGLSGGMITWRRRLSSAQGESTVQK
ncbi:MAG: MFS transporter [Firmicutes bacterium]|nr:MFS transporter [Bacillota bacterium]